LSISGIARPEDKSELTREEELDLDLREQVAAMKQISSGEIQFTGRATYVYDDDEEREDEYFPTVQLETDDYLQGEISVYYALTPKALKDSEGDDIVATDSNSQNTPALPELWLELNNVVAYNAAGVEIDRQASVQVKFENEGVSFHKIVRQFGEATEIAVRVEANEPSTKEALAGEVFLEQCRLVENDLNFNKYYEIEMVEAEKYHRKQLSKAVIDVPIDKVLYITASNVEMIDDSELQVIEQPAYYDGPTIIRSESIWRVAHGFSMIQTDGTVKRAHVFPNELQDIR
jgi:hypothetical protein